MHSLKKDNLLIHGENLAALKSLSKDYNGKVKCIYIDPPYNTKQTFTHYKDNKTHVDWLDMMRERVELMRNLLRDDGSMWISIDDREMPYLTILMDEVFGRENRVNTIVVKMSESSGVKMKHVDKRLPKLKEYILLYKKGHDLRIHKDKKNIDFWNDEYKTILIGLSKNDVCELKTLAAVPICYEKEKVKANKILSKAKTTSLHRFFQIKDIPKSDEETWKFENAWRIIQFVGSKSILRLAIKEGIKRQEIAATISNHGILYFYKTSVSSVVKSPRIQMLFADDHLKINQGDLWLDIKTTGAVANEGGHTFPNGKKPERLLQRIIHLATNPGDLVLDSFAGSGTTGAVAHKMGRRWIMIELGDHCHTHIIPRINKVIAGEDQGGITKDVGWEGGGGFELCELGSSDEFVELKSF